MAFLTADNTALPVQQEALYPTASTGTILAGNVATVFALSLGSLQPTGGSSAGENYGELFDAKSVLIVIANNGTGQTITAATLTFSDTVGALTPSINYVLPSVSIANNASGLFVVSLTSGALKNISLSVTFGVAPVAGSVNAQAMISSSEVTQALNITQVNGAALGASNPLPIQEIIGGAVISSSNPLPIGHSSATQVTDPNGNLQAAVQTSFDNQPQLGVPAGAQNFISPFSTTIAASITLNASPQAVTPAAMSGTNRGAAWAIKVGSFLLIDTGTNQEMVRVSAVTSTTFSAIFTKNHTGPVTVAGEVLNQAKDATVPNPTGAGASQSATLLWNKIAGQWEEERSYAGELGGASGTGFNTSLAFEQNGATLDPERSMQGKGQVTARTISSGGGASSTSVTLDAVPVGLQPGQQITFLGGTQETVYTAPGYTAGANPVLIAGPTIDSTAGLANTHANGTGVSYDAQNFNGPGKNAVSAQGVGGGEPMVLADVNSSTTGNYYYQQNANAQGQPYANAAMESVGLDNGASLDKMAGNQNLSLINASAVTTTQVSADQTNINARGIKVFVNMSNVGTGSVTVNIQFKDPFGNYFTVLSTLAIVANGTAILTIYPGLATSANSSLNDVLVRTWRIQAVANNANPTTYTVGAMTIL